MADRKISQLTNLTGADLADVDEFAVVDASATETKAITFGELKSALDTSTGFVRITGDTMTGDLGVPNITASGTITATSFSGDGSSLTGIATDVVDDTTPQLGGNLDTNTHDILFGDNDKAIFGAGSDLQIYHDGSNSIINDNGTGALQLQVGGSTKLATTATGVDVTGTVTADGLTVDGDITLTAGDKLKFNDDRYFTPENNIDGAEVSANGVFRVKTGATPVPRLLVGGFGDISFYEDTGTTPKFFWDASAESLGIGNSIPSNLASTGNNLVVGSGSGNEGMTIYSSGFGSIYFADGTTGDDAYKGIIQYNHSTNALDIYANYVTGDVPSMRIDSSGRVGIGTSSPQGNAVHIVPSGGNTALFLSSSTGDTNSDEVNIVAVNKVNTGFQPLNLKAYETRFYSGASEVVRIDSSGNLLVGKTVTTFANNGVALKSSGEVNVTRNDGVPFYIRRNTSDGDIVQFWKDGSTVGSIAGYGGQLIIGTGNTGLRFQNAIPAVIPRTTSDGASDGVFDLGDSNARFKDLYLSGGVYLGGTGAANYLDDYEEGTFTPTIANLSNLTGTASITRAIYTKVGNLCTIQVRISGLTITSSATVTFFSATLPTAAAMDTVSEPAITGVARATNSAATGVVTNWTNANATQVGVVFIAETVGSSGAFDITYSLTYRTA